jgi:hypothetical protein
MLVKILAVVLGFICGMLLSSFEKYIKKHHGYNASIWTHRALITILLCSFVYMNMTLFAWIVGIYLLAHCIILNPWYVASLTIPKE